VRELDARAERLLARPVEVRLDELDARPFAERDEEAVANTAGIIWKSGASS
jgi:hypothetical protein